jgi:iron complex transport system ATP-binding protein
MSIAPAIEVDELSVKLGGTDALQQVSMDVTAGEWLGVIGPNGAGKTTLLRALAGLIGYAGNVRLRGQTVAASNRRELARQVALVPQIPQIPAELTVAEYVLLGRTPHIGYFGSETRTDRLAAERAISRLALRPFATRLLRTLSGGELQRAVLARALAQEAQVLLLDEPTSALDLGGQQQALELVDLLRRDQQLTVISVMHDLSLAGQYADRLLLLARGVVVTDGDPHTVLTERMIAAYYDADVQVLHTHGSVFVLPTRKKLPANRDGNRDD